MVITIWNLFGIIVFAQYIDTYKVYILNKKGQIQPVNGVLHIDINNTSTLMKKRLNKQFNEFLRKPKPYQATDLMDALSYRDQKRSKNNYIDITQLMDRSPVVYSNGRYTLDLDKIDVQDLQDATNRPEIEQEYYDPDENFRDYYDYIGVNERLRTDKKIKWDQLKTLSKYFNNNLRKHNRILLNAQARPRYGRNSDVNHRSQKKRFAVINNGGRKKKNQYENDNQDKPEGKTTDLETDEDKINDASEVSPKDSDNEESQETDEYDDGVYLQGNTLVKFGNQNSENNNDTSENNSVTSSESTDEDDDEDHRRRLQHFLPKRYHWDNSDFEKLGYFWFNGRQGKYSGPEPLN